MESLPHVRGGVSSWLWNFLMKASSSPRAWGCFQLFSTLDNFFRVFPTCVGVFLLHGMPSVRSGRLPHVRGGVSVSSSRF